LTADHYAMLAVPPGVSAQELREAYLRLAQELHPDAGLQPDGARFSEVTAAYAVLRDPARRKRYDAELDMTRKPCEVCHGVGITYRMRGFHERAASPCVSCGGTGRL
jgi:DnaJ-class molecular chaperone